MRKGGGDAQGRVLRPREGHGHLRFSTTPLGRVETRSVLRGAWRVHLVRGEGQDLSC